MGILHTLKRRYDRTIGKRRFEQAAKKVLATPPLAMRDCALLYVSMLCHRDVHAYLLAIKSLYVQVGMGRVLVVNDGSLLPSDIDLLRHHIALIDFVHIQAVDTGRCPRGGTWERLVKILELTASNFVIQVDADTLTSGPVPEVAQYFQQNRSFLLGTRASQKISTAPEVAKMVRGWIDDNHWTTYSVGVAAEGAIDTLLHAHRFAYAHASSGFAGFARGAFDLAALEDFSIQMRERLGARWDEWGTEQIASNFMIANAPNATVLPFDRYACFEPHIPVAGRPFLHFIGAYRFNDGLYRKRARAFLKTMSSSA
jgi:hypothetical protein